MTARRWREELQVILGQTLNEDQVRQVCFDLGIDLERLKEPSQAGTVAALIEFCRRRSLLQQLQTTIRWYKPGVKFETVFSDGGSRVKVEIEVNLDILSFSSQQRSELVQAIAEQFHVAQDDIHVLTEAAGSTWVVLGMPRQDAEKLVAAYGQKDSRFQALDEAFGILRIHMAASEPGRREKLSVWQSHRFRGAVRLILYLGGFLIMILSGVALARNRVPRMDVFTVVGAVLKGDFSVEHLGQFVLWTVLGALPGAIAWAALPVILAKFVGKLYHVGSPWETFEYMFLCVFGPLFSSYPLVIVKEGQVEAKSRTLPQGKPNGPGGPCRFVVHNDSAVIIERGGRRVAVVGPSSYVAGRFEKIHQIIDLRPQTNTTTASVITRDGIPVKVQAGITFRIRWRGEPTAEEPYPADPDALLQAAAAQAVVRAESGKPTLRNWADRVGGSLDGTLRNIVARYRLDELLEPHDPGARPRSDLERNYAEELKKSASGMGAEVTEVRLGAFEFDKVDLDIKRQWMDTWQSWWTGQARALQAQAEATATHTREMADAYAQQEMIAAITRELQSASREGSIPDDLITLRLVEVIRQMAANPESAVYLPPEALQTLDGARKMLQEAKQAPELALPAGKLPASGATSTLPGPLTNKRLLARLRVDQEMKLFGDAERNRLTQSIAVYVQVPEQDIRLRYVIPGSVLVTLEMPEHAALKLLKGYLDRDSLFRELAISNVELRPVLAQVAHEPQSQPQVGPKYLGALAPAASVEPAATGQVDLSGLFQSLMDHFSEDELQDLCIFELPNIAQVLQVEGKDTKIRELITYCGRHGLVPDLEKTVRRLRPNALG